MDNDENLEYEVIPLFFRAGVLAIENKYAYIYICDR